MTFKDRYAVETASDGPAALRALHGGSFDLLILDFDLGEGPSGLDILRALRERGNLTPAILTARAARREEIAFLQSGGRTTFLPKPFSGSEILAAAEELRPAEATPRLEAGPESPFPVDLDEEFRTPLTAILGYSEMLADPAAGELNLVQREALDRIQLNTNRLGSCLENVSNLLDKLVAGTRRPERAPEAGSRGPSPASSTP